MDSLRELTGLKRSPEGDRPPSRRMLGLLVTAQILLVVAALPDRRAAAAIPVAPSPLGLAAAAIVEPGDGTAPGDIASRAAWPTASRAQITFEPEQEGWTAVLWFDGPDSVIPLYPSPSRSETGWTTPGKAYVLPAAGSYLRLTSTAPGGDFVALVTSLQPDPEIQRVLLDPQPAAVRALRDRLVRESDSRASAPTAIERYLPTTDGRAVAVPWTRLVGTGRVVLGWRVAVED